MEKFCVKFLKYSVGLIALFLSIMSFLFTQRLGQEKLGEILNGAPIYEMQDNVFLHIGGIVFVLVVFVILDRLLKKWCWGNKGLSVKIFQGVIAFVAGGIALAILLGGERTPIDDQIQVVGAATLFNEDNYINLTKGGYVNMYPHQLGYILYLQLVFKLFGNGNYFAVRVINCLFIGGTSYYISKIINVLTQNVSCRIIGSLSTLLLFPLLLMCSWVYGDVPCLFFSFVLIYHYICFCKNQSWRDAVLVILAACLCLIFRKNSLIILIALAIVSIVQFISNRKKSLLLCAGLACAIPILCIQLIETHYQNVSGYTLDGGIPSIMWIAMGTIEGESKPGWFNNFCVSTYYSTDCNQQLSKQIAREEIVRQLSDYLNNPVKGISFFKRKICTQWNDPYYGCSALVSIDSDVNAIGLTEYLLEKGDGIIGFLSVFQFVVYTGLLLYLLICYEKSEFYNHIIIVIILGGFLFSILWEANSRYVFPYFTMMLPVSVLGWKAFSVRVFNKLER